MIVRITLNILLWLLGATLILASGDGVGLVPGDEGGETRRFDQYPVLLEIAGNGVVVAGQRGEMNLVADATQFRANYRLSLNQTYGADLSLDGSTAIEIFDPRPVLIHRTDGSDFYDSKIDIAAAANVAVVQRIGLRASNPRSTVSRVIFVVPAGRNYLASLIVSQPVLQSGSAAEALLTLSQPAPANGARIDLQVSSPVLTVPASVTIPAGATETRFQVTGSIDSLQRYAIVTAAYDGVEQQAGIWVRATEPFLLALDIPERLTDGNTDPARIRVKAVLSAPAAAGKLALRLQSNNSLVTFPDALPALNGGSAIVIGGGKIEVPFDLLVAPLFELGSVRITAELIRDTGQGGATVNELVADTFFGASQTAELESVSFRDFLSNGFGLLSTNCIDTYRGSYSEVTIKLSRPAPRDYQMEMYASNPSVLRLNRVFPIPEGQSEVTFRMDPVAGGPPETCTQVGPFCTSIGNYPRPDADMRRFTRIIVRALRTGKTISFDRWVSFRASAPGPVIDPFTLDAATLRGGQTITGIFGVVTNNDRDDLPITIRVANGPSSEYIWRAQYRANDRLPFALATQATDTPTPATVVASGPINCLGGSSDDPAVPAPSVRRTVNLLPGGYLTRLSMGNPNFFGGETAQLTIELNRPAGAGGINVVLSDDFPNSPLRFPASVFVPEGSDRAVVPVGSLAVTGFTERILRAAAEGIEKAITVTLLPEPSSLILIVSPGAVVGGQVATLRVIADRAYPVPLPASLLSTSAAAPVPASVSLNPIGSGPSETSYAITTLAVAASTTVTFTAQVRGQSASAQLRIDPPNLGNTLRNLSVGFSPGSAAGMVTSNPGSINCAPTGGACTENFQDTTAVTLTVVPAAGASLTSNSGCDSFVPASGATPARCQVRMTNDRIVSFGFTSTPPPVPSITQQPQNVTVAVGATATFSIIATGALPLSYRWQRGGVDIPGATAATYTTPATTNADDGAMFRVIVSNAAGSVTSQAAVLTVGRGWRQIGAAVSGNSFAPSLALDGNGTRYVAHISTVNGVQQLLVSRFENGAWMAVGAGAVNAGSNEDPNDTALVIGGDGLPVVAWLESSRVRVARWTGVQWQLIADNLVDVPSNLAANVISLQLARLGNDLIVGWVEPLVVPAAQRRIAVKRYGGLAVAGNWSGGYIPAVTNARTIRLAVDTGGFPAVAYLPERADLMGTDAIRVVRQSASGWEALGGNVGPVPSVVLAGQMTVLDFDIKIDVANTPIVIGNVDSRTIFAYRYMANAWQPLTAPDGVFVSLNAATENSAMMAFTRGGPEITMAYARQQRQPSGAFLYFFDFLNWNGAAWSPVGEPLSRSLPFGSRSLALATAGGPTFVTNSGSSVIVMQYVP